MIKRNLIVKYNAFDGEDIQKGSRHNSLLDGLYRILPTSDISFINMS